MTADPLAAVNLRATPQTEQADPRQELNNAGGYVFTLDDTARLKRFLTIGVEAGTYYVGERELTKDNADVVLRMARGDTATLVETVVEISTAGRAPKQNPALFALAAAAGLGDDAGRKLALDALPLVARTGTHLFLFARYVEQFRGWGRGLRRAVAGWYLDKTVDDLAYQLVKYRQREGWAQRDLLRLSHPKPASDDHARRALFDWAAGREASIMVPPVVAAYLEVQTAPIPELVGLIAAHPLSWEMLPDVALAEPTVWEALLDKGMPQTALMRQLPRLTRLGVIAPMSARTQAVAAQLADPDRLRKARVHPFAVLLAQRTYASGRGARGHGEWTPVREIVDALDAAFYAAYGAVEPANKRTMLALDVSGSMGDPVAGLPLSCREASAALALVTAATEPRHMIVGFTSSRGFGGPAALTPLAISPRQRLDDAVQAVSNLPFGGTDCALPMQFALREHLEIDTFVVATDNETWAGGEHPHQALRRYREQTGIPAKLIVLAMTPTKFSIADPADAAGSLDIAGLDAAVPQLIADFSRGL